MIADPTMPEVRYICRNLRPSSREEMFMLLPHDDPDQLAERIFALPGFKWVSYADDYPASILGACPRHPGTWDVFGFGTEDYADVLMDVTKTARREMFPAVYGSGCLRAQAMSPASHVETHKWLRLLGGQEEATLRAYGKGGEDVTIFAWYREDADVRRRRA